MDIQLIIVILIGIAVAALLVRNVYRFFFTIDRKENPCGGCTACGVSKQWNKEAPKDPYRAYLDID